jgi:dihydrodipicolinate synthase/N-acetylneuraminate lyase
MAHIKPKGSFVALVTPMNVDGSIDYEGFRTLLDWHAANGTDAVLIMGSTGEVSMLSPQERKEIVEKTMPMKHFTYSAINPVATKSLMRALGLPSGPLRKPLKPLAPEKLQAGLDAYERLGLVQAYGLSRPRMAAE